MSGTARDHATVRVARASITDVQMLAAAYRQDDTLHGAEVETPLPRGALFWMARDAGDRPIGYTAATPRQDGLVIGPVYVRPAHRRRGVGLALLGEVERFAETARIPVVEVSVAADNVPGVRFLERAGYRTRRLLMTRDRDRARDRGSLPLRQAPAAGA